jgi:hypothetical protein
LFSVAELAITQAHSAHHLNKAAQIPRRPPAEIRVDYRSSATQHAPLPARKGLRRFEDTTIQVPERHTRIPRLRKPLQFDNLLKLPSGFDGRDRKRVFSGLQANLDVRMFEKIEQQYPLVTLSALQFIRDIRHLIEEPVELCYLTTKERFILRYDDFGKRFHQNGSGHIGQCYPLHRFNTLKSSNASRPT